ncbi:DUF5681 domain-containing protein [Alloalcanivorax gelatiniphagus]|uniref:DUF5681 domain-containing protein n=1 Tax=Alloalcanivorax gelatiniphagus TaxID=1194167 RepID=A0ABY2XPA6_9GAMM|nr:DUF5681 domain-containing protein [Alloalcanivorax gelatiniphagus]TMW13744.1 hypothetical protein FGS76_06350 [Alloalcanivorax gelatiniphagus]
MAQFKPGKSGNPKGKPKGAQSRFTKMREELKTDLPDLLESTKQAALAGDMTAMRLLLERTLPPLKATAAPLVIEGLEQAATLTDKAALILAAIARGDMPPDVGASLVDALGRLAKLKELDDLEARIAALEEQQ